MTSSADQRNAPWRGWQRAALVALAVLGALFAFGLALASLEESWRVPDFPPDQLWLAIVLLVVALAAVPLLFRFSRRKGRTARIVDGAVTAAGALGVIAVLFLAPDTNPAVGIGLRVPLLLTASVLLAVAGVASMVASRLEPAPSLNLGQLLARIAVPVVLVLAMIFGVAPLWRSFALTTNEYVSGTRGPVTPSTRSALTGEVAWSSTSKGYNSDGFRKAVGTAYGIATSRTIGSVEMLDPTTGELRWRYSRSDSDGLPDIWVTGDGSQLLVSFDDVGFLVLDADTGERKAAWPGGARDNDVLSADPLVTGGSVSKGSDKLYGTDTDGNHRWTVEPGRCTSITAVATADTAVASFNRSCNKEPDELTGLDLKSGKKLWSHAEDWKADPLAIGSLIVGLQSARELVGVEARTGEVKWRWPLPAALACETKLHRSGAQIVLLNCPSNTDKTQTTVTVINAGTGELAWQRTAPIDTSAKPAVTEDGRVVAFVELPSGCRLDVVEESGYRAVPVPKEVRCNQGVEAVGNVVLARGKDSLIALE
ncbi:PQQ-binding-like beta-propeller repeat protein [Kribbella sp. NPDC056861]|uniref:outer membrane protein assembly factor BamB family protein n=1 Tax=Kribbella sp. NPDC056861 TaxID=3154857 RepID=UPI00341FF6F5